MDNDDLTACLSFLQSAENLKNTLRSAHTSAGRRESSAEHSWRLGLMVILFQREFAGLDLDKLMKLAILHDLAEAVTGDIPAVLQNDSIDKGRMEFEAMEQLLGLLPPTQREEVHALWMEYENLSTPEAEVIKGLDKLETILQHNQGDNPKNFDYGFNLNYGQEHMKYHPLLGKIRAILDDATRAREAGR